MAAHFLFLETPISAPHQVLSASMGARSPATASFDSARATTLNAGGGTINVANGTTLTMNGVIGGGGELTKGDTGTLVLTGIDTYSGATNLHGGTLSVSRDANLGDASAPLRFDGGGLSTTASFAMARPIRLNGHGEGFFLPATGTTLTVNGDIGGKGIVV